MKELLKKILPVVFLVCILIIIQSCNKPTTQDKSDTQEEAVMSKTQPRKGNGFYIDPNLKSQEEVDQFIAQCKRLMVNKIFIETKNSKGELLYPSNKFPTARKTGDFDCYGAICDAARKADIATHAWYVVFHEGAENPVPIIKEHPEYLIVNRDGKSNVEQPTWSSVDPKCSTYWVCPTAKGYRDYLKEMMQDVIDRYNVDGIHLDYIRYPEEVDARKYCYCDRCKALFKENYGYTLPANDVIKNRYWVTQMCNNVTNAVIDFADFAHEHNKQISAYVFTDYTTAVEAVYQNWPWFSRYLDFVIPTSYEASPSYIHEMAKRSKAVLNKDCMLFPTVYAAPAVRRSEDGGNRWYKGQPEDVVSTFNAWIEEDVDGVVFFTYGLMNHTDYLTKEQRENNAKKISEISQNFYAK